jgi:hypothetical protein
VSARIPAALLLLVFALAVAGCGGDDEGKPIPSATANALNAELEGVQARLDNGSAGACTDSRAGPRGPNRERVEQIIDSMPDDVDSDVRSALEDSFDNLWDLVQQDCDDKAQEEEAQQEEPEQPEETQTDTTPTDTTPTDTDTDTNTDTTPTDTTPTTPEEAPLPNDGDGNGVPGNNGNGNGNGGGVGPDLGGGE